MSNNNLSQHQVQEQNDYYRNRAVLKVASDQSIGPDVETLRISKSILVVDFVS